MILFLLLKFLKRDSFKNFACTGIKVVKIKIKYNKKQTNSLLTLSMPKLGTNFLAEGCAVDVDGFGTVFRLEV
jgi:hypothetical protein